MSVRELLQRSSAPKAPYIDYTKQMFEILEFSVKEVPVITDMRNGPACEREDLRTSLKNFGSALVLEESQK
nr:hypothetical protein [Desulfosporosinus sp. BG]